jgi:threonine aldolase
MTWKAGVDVVSFGATKNGCLACEAVIFFDPARAEHFQYRRKRSGHTLSKGRFLGSQLIAYLAHNHWVHNARHANQQAQLLAKGLQAVPGVRLAWAVEANEVFAILPRAIESRLSEAGVRAAPWYESSVSLAPHETVGSGEVFWRFVTSFATTTEDIATVIKTATA